MTQSFNHKFNIGQYIYHKTPDSDKGIIIDIHFSVLNGRAQYIVAFGSEADAEARYEEFELSPDKLF